MALQNNVPPPISDAIANLQKGGLITQPWIDFFTALGASLEKAPGRIASIELTGQTAAIASTPVTPTPINAGLYHVKFFLRLQSVDSVSASVVLTVSFTLNGATRNVVSGTLGANTLTQVVGNPQPLIRVDANTLITYSTAVFFGGVGGSYALDIVIDEVSA